MTTFSCGVEEPLQTNKQLYALNEATGSIELAEFSLDELNRYCFVPEEELSCRESLASILSRIAAALGVAATWLVAFGTSAGSPVRARVLAGRLAKQGWHVFRPNAEFDVATKEFLLTADQQLSPPDADPLISGWTVLLGPSPEEGSLLTSEATATLRMLALTHRLQPSREFLTACGASGLTVAYLAKGTVERSGLVVVSPSRLGLVVRGMHRDGTIRQLLEGGDASNVWRI